MSNLGVELATLTLPDFGSPSVEPTIPDTTYTARIADARQRAADAHFDALLVYADREHNANLAYLTNYDPRFEEALLILVPERTPTLLVGNEGVAYTNMIPVPFERVLFQSFSLVSQPRDKNPSLRAVLEQAGVNAGMRVGIAGWKYFEPTDTDIPDEWIELPAFIVDILRTMGCTVRNAGALFMHPEQGLRAINEVDQLALFEYASTTSSQSVRDLLFSIEPGMSEYECVQRMNWNGIPLGYHTVVMSGERTRFGLASPLSRKIQQGDPIIATLGVWGSNTARAGFLVHDADEMPEGVQDYVDKLVAPYFRAVADWYALIGIGTRGGDLYDAVHRVIGDPFFGVTLNPGHLIHIDEWVSSPVTPNSDLRLRSGMAIQVDVIPGTGTPYFTTNIEDTIALADDALRAEFAAKYPEAWGRIQQRREFMQNVLGITLKPEVLPFSNLPAYLPPYWLSPERAMRSTHKQSHK